MSKKSEVKEKSYSMQVLENLPQGRTIYTALIHRSKSGMTTHLKALVAVNSDNNPEIHCIHLPEASSYNRKDEVFKVKGCGMDMGFALVYELGEAIHGNGYYFRHSWI